MAHGDCPEAADGFRGEPRGEPRGEHGGEPEPGRQPSMSMDAMPWFEHGQRRKFGRELRTGSAGRPYKIVTPHLRLPLPQQLPPFVGQRSQ